VIGGRLSNSPSNLKHAGLLGWELSSERERERECKEYYCDARSTDGTHREKANKKGQWEGGRKVARWDPTVGW